MPENWIPFRNAGLILVILASVAMIVNAYAKAHISDRIHEIEAQYKAGEYADGADAEAKERCEVFVGSEKADCKKRIYRRAWQQQRQEYDLQAQRKTANWSEAMGQAAISGLLASIVGVTLLFLTYDQQRAATELARGDAEAARQDARDLLEHARSVSRAELRPYLFVEKIHAEEVLPRMFRLTVQFKNYGRTPARKIRAFVNFYVGTSLIELREFTEDDEIYLDAAAPDACRKVFGPLTFTEEEWAASTLDVHGIVRTKYTYEDDAGKEYGEAFDYSTDRLDISSDPPTFYLLTDWTKDRYAKSRTGNGDLFDTPVRKRGTGGAAKPKPKAKQKARKRKPATKPGTTTK